MCGIVGVVARGPVNQLLYDSLQLLRHRGQDAAGIATGSGSTFSMWKGNGMVREIFSHSEHAQPDRQRRDCACALPDRGLGVQRRGSAAVYVNAPFGITLGHNGNLTNAEQLKSEMFRIDRRHINTNSDSEILLNVFAHELQEERRATRSIRRRSSVQWLRCIGACAGLRVRCAIADHGIVAFRDPYGIRPLVTA